MSQTKAEYVLSQPFAVNHRCHWPDCKKQVPPAMWGCSKHWYILPPTLRSKLWAAYRPSQERDKKPSEEYIKVAHEIQEWIKVYLHYRHIK